MRRIRILEQERPGLGIEFNHAINAALDLLEQDIVPLASLLKITDANGAKRLVLKRFPFDIIVRELNDEMIVAAIAHHSRQPGYWRNRGKLKKYKCSDVKICSLLTVDPDG